MAETTSGATLFVPHVIEKSSPLTTRINPAFVLPDEFVCVVQPIDRHFLIQNDWNTALFLLTEFCEGPRECQFWRMKAPMGQSVTYIRNLLSD